MNTKGEGVPKYQPVPEASKLPRLANPPTTLWNIQHIFVICSQYFNDGNCSVQYCGYSSQSLTAWGQAMQSHRRCLQNINSREPNQDSSNQQGEMSSSLTSCVNGEGRGTVIIQSQASTSLTHSTATSPYPTQGGQALRGRHCWDRVGPMLSHMETVVSPVGPEDFALTEAWWLFIL